MLLADLDRETKWQLISSTCRASFEEFCREFWGEVSGAQPLQWNWHLDVFCNELQAVAKRVHRKAPALYDLVCNVSPGTSKSTVWSILFHPWVWSWFPQARFMTSSHTESLVLDLADKARDVIKSEKYRQCYPHVKLVNTQDTKGYYRNSLGGDRYACTVGGKSPMGFHAHFLLGDDLLNPQKALSQVESETARKFVENYLPTRMVDKSVSVMMLVMQRLGRGDPTEIMIEVGKRDGARPVRVICLPAELVNDKVRSIVSPPELLSRYNAEGLMDPVRLSRGVLASYRARGRTYYAAQFLQEPLAEGGGMFREEWFNQRVCAAPYHAQRVRFWDRASTADGGCYTAGVLMAKGPDGRLYVENVVHGQWEPNERNDKMEAVARRDRDRYGPNNDPVVVIEAERGSTGLESFQNMARRLMGFRVREDLPSGSKDVRAEPWADQLAAKNVWIVEDGTWDVYGYVQEHCLFKPSGGARLGKFKDQVDASSGALGRLVSSRASSAQQFRILSLRPADAKEPLLRLVVCSRAELEQVTVEERALLVNFVDPPAMRGGVMCNDAAILHLSSDATGSNGPALSGARDGSAGGHVILAVGSGEYMAAAQTAASPAHGLSNLLGSVTLEFGDLDPAEHQERWEQPLPDLGGMSPAQLRMLPEHGKRLWRLLMQHRDPPWQICVLCDGGDRRALSAAYAVADTLRLGRAEHIYQVLDPEGKHEQAPGNRHVYEVVQASRGMVM